MLGLIEKAFLDPFPHRSFYLAAVRKLKLFDYAHRVTIGAVERPHYGYALYQGAKLAKKLGHSRVSAIEFGVAGGNGLVNLEYHAAEISRCLDIKVDVFGFDTGGGLPAPVDYRDLPYHWQSGSYAMDQQALRSRLKSAELVLGNLSQTANSFLASRKPAPIAAVIVDVDFYSSTVMALKLFSGIEDRFILPRVYFYFDDICGTEAQAYSDFTGEGLAIREFNDAHPTQKFSPAFHLLSQKVVRPWHHALRVLHNFGHAQYDTFVSAPEQELRLA